MKKEVHCKQSEVRMLWISLLAFALEKGVLSLVGLAASKRP
jgi:hypothetical protein